MYLSLWSKIENFFTQFTLTTIYKMMLVYFYLYFKSKIRVAVDYFTGRIKKRLVTKNLSIKTRILFLNGSCLSPWEKCSNLSNKTWVSNINYEISNTNICFVVTLNTKFFNQNFIKWVCNVFFWVKFERYSRGFKIEP